MRKKNKLLSGALALATGAFLSKILGAIYRIPLTNLLGGDGLGLYQMIFPVYVLLLDLSGAGLPNALSKIISSKINDNPNIAEQYLKTSIRLFWVIGAIGTIFVLISSKFLSSLQGDSRAYLGYILISPSVLLVSIISCYRGYFQGKMNMAPTAVSQVVEQVVKLGIGVIFIKIFNHNLVKAVGLATLAITISELTALLYLTTKYKTEKTLNLSNFIFDKTGNKQRIKEILKITFPVTLVGIIIPLSQVVDSFIIINLLSSYRFDATTLYGLFSGASSTVIGLPVSICYGLAVASIPTVSASKTEQEQTKNGIKSMLYTLILSLPCLVAIVIGAPIAVKVLFNGLSVAEKNLVVSLIKISSPIVVLLSFMQTTNAVLIGKGKTYGAVINMSIGVVIKTVLNILLIKIPKLNIYGGAVALIACYFSVCLLNLIMIFYKREANASKITYRRQCVG